ncbi:GTPase Era, mitochondrial [Cylas formicarius]|uniref:GTPase Era, mitochondrial n=1 Tax=Cylas formicarius TaxID=197179 RepID=UPI002958A88F|nr:GTPase Era, mitochondrial [Cylas formicarius]
MFLKSCRHLFIFNKDLLFTRFCTQAANELKNSELCVETAQSKLLKVAILGLPNAGKSTFINNLMDRRVCPTSSKVHTTRNKTMAIFTEEDSQIVFLDTPGLVSDSERKRYKLESTFVRDSKDVLMEADIIGVIHDVSNHFLRDKLDIKIINLLESHRDICSFLVFNKVDLLKSKRKLLDLTRLLTENCINGKPIAGTQKTKKCEHDYRGWPYFQDIFMVSALTGDGISSVKNYLVKQAKPSEWMFPKNVWTDQSAEEIISKSVQATLLDYLPQEIPYRLKSEIEFFDISKTGIISTVVLIHCPSERVKTLIGGASEGRLRQMTETVQDALQNTFKSHVRIKLVLVPPKKEDAE